MIFYLITRERKRPICHLCHIRGKSTKLEQREAGRTDGQRSSIGSREIKQNILPQKSTNRLKQKTKKKKKIKKMEENRSAREFPAFPYKPYSIQMDFMNALYRFLDNGGVSMLESPTGNCISMISVFD